MQTVAPMTREAGPTNHRLSFIVNQVSIEWERLILTSLSIQCVVGNAMEAHIEGSDTVATGNYGCRGINIRPGRMVVLAVEQE